MGGFVVTLVYGFSRATGDLDVLEIAPAAAGRSMLEFAMRGSPLHKKYKIYLDRVGVAKVPENYEDRLTEIFPEPLNTFASWRSIHTTWLYPSWNATSNGTETM